MFLLGMMMEMLIRFPIRVGNDNCVVGDEGDDWCIGVDCGILVRVIKF